MKLIAIFFTLFPMVFACVGGGLAWKQHRIISVAQPVDAKVLGSRVETQTSTSRSNGRSRTTTSYKPIIGYRYTIDGREYDSDEVWPIEQSLSSRSAANKIAGQYPVGRSTTAYYDPGNPERAFLIGKHSFLPYIFVIFPSIFWAASAAIVFGVGASPKAPPEPRATPEGWYEVRASSRTIDRLRVSSIVAGCWQAYGAAAWGHYFAVADAPYETIAYGFTAVYVGLGAIPLAFAIYYLLLRRNVGDARVLVDANRFAPGAEIAVSIGQPVKSPISIEKLSVGLVCDEQTRTKRGSKTSYSTRKLYEEIVPTIEQHEARPGDLLAGSQTLRIPRDHPPSSPPGFKGYPRHQWSVRVKTEIDGSPDYRGKFPIRVEEGGPAE